MIFIFQCSCKTKRLSDADTEWQRSPRMVVRYQSSFSWTDQVEIHPPIRQHRSWKTSLVQLKLELELLTEYVQHRECIQALHKMEILLKLNFVRFHLWTISAWAQGVPDFFLWSLPVFHFINDHEGSSQLIFYHQY